MAQITWGTIEPLDVPNFNVSVIANIFPTAQDPDLIAGDYRLLGEPDVVTQFLGSGFTFANGFPVGGVVSSLVTTDGGRLVGRFDGLAIPAADLAQWIFAGDDATARAALFAGDDTIQASPFDDVVQGFAGNDIADGGAGTDALVLLGSAADYELVSWSGQVGAVPTSGALLAANGVDKGLSIEQLVFAGSSEVVAVPEDNLDPLAYIASYDDLIAAFGVNAQAGFDHYLYHGVGEGRGTSFDGLQYIASHPDLIAAFGPDATTGAAHFIAFGAPEGRARDSFDAEQYLANYADLQAAFGTDTTAATEHFITNGFAENRSDDPPLAIAAAEFLL